MPQLVEEEGGAECALLVAVGMANGLHRVDALAARALEAWRHRREAVACGGGRQCRAHGAGDEEEGEGAGRWGCARGGRPGEMDWTGAGRGERRETGGGRRIGRERWYNVRSAAIRATRPEPGLARARTDQARPGPNILMGRAGLLVVPCPQPKHELTGPFRAVSA